MTIAPTINTGESAGRAAGLPTAFPVKRLATWPLLGGAIAAGVLTDQAIRAGVLGAATALLGVSAAAVLLSSRRLQSRESQLVVAAAPLFSSWAAVRASGWLVPIDLLAALALLVLGASLASGGSLADTNFGTLAARAWHATGHVLAAPTWVRPLIAARFSRGRSTAQTQLRSIAVGAAVAVPVIVVLGALLASADAVFASVIRVEVPWSGGTVALSGFLISVGAWTMLGLTRLASAEAPTPLQGPAWRLGRLEFKIVLVSIEVLFGLFAIAQVAALSGAADHILRTANLSYADYARSGFFQLLWVAGLTVTGLLALRSVVDHTDVAARRSFLRLSLPVIALTLMIVATAVRRLALYEQAYGLTMLRLYSLVFAVWIGAVLVLLAVQISARGGVRSWFPAAAGGCALAIVLMLNAVNPEALVAKHNLARSSRAVATDTAYLADLSDDAVPTIARLLPKLDEPARSEVRAQMCATAPDSDTGPAAWNLGRNRANRARAKLCGG